ncbi:MAG: BCCT family transporter [Coprobacillus cateniformis]|uniref:BCCT family transporter n=1 Tax=Longibaculum muris TaxID=1796628 RepID=UPI003AB7F8C1|nr:BCCT family transporter [Coprobacillus cateniformis]
MKKNNQLVFIISVAIAILVIVYGYVYSSSLVSVSDSIMSWVSNNFGWLYILSVFGFIIFLAFIAISKWGNVKLGKDDDIPEYSNFSWFAMLFCGATGIGLVFWSIAEPLSHYVNPPQGIEAGTVSAAEFSIRTCFLHWGITQFACFAIVGLGLAYFMFRKGKTALISNILEPLIGEKAVNGLIGKIIDIFSVVVTFAGVATSLGLGVSQICGGLNYLADVPNTNITWLIVIAVITCVFLASAISGVNKGIKILSSINTWIAITLLIVAFLVGPKVPILNTLVSSTGQHIQNFFSDVTMISAFGDNTWTMNWRVFYYAWFIAWCPFVGMFIARISKGRTIKEFIIGAVIAPTMFTILWLSVFGTIALSTTGTFSMTALGNMIASPETAVFIIFEQFPLSKILSILVIVLLAIFFVTSADSATYSLSMMTSNGDMEPPKYKKIIWGIIEASIAYLLLSAGSLKPLQTLSIAASLPFLFIMIAMCPALVKELKKEISK